MEAVAGEKEAGEEFTRLNRPVTHYQRSVPGIGYATILLPPFGIRSHFRSKHSALPTRRGRTAIPA